MRRTLYVTKSFREAKFPRYCFVELARSAKMPATQEIIKTPLSLVGRTSAAAKTLVTRNARNRTRYGICGVVREVYSASRHPVYQIPSMKLSNSRLKPLNMRLSRAKATTKVMK